MKNDMMSEVSETFKENTDTHTMKVRLDNGIYRHLEFSKPGSNIYRFDLITYPGYLVVSGDMGEWVFSRLPDMFEFFRSPEGTINPVYWAEKCKAADYRNGLKIFDVNIAKRSVKEYLQELYENNPEILKDVVDKADNDIRYYDGPHRFYDSCYNFTTDSGHQPFSEFESIPDPMTWSHHYLWILHAIVWGINQYDKRTGIMHTTVTTEDKEETND